MSCHVFEWKKCGNKNSERNSGNRGQPLALTVGHGVPRCAAPIDSVDRAFSADAFSS